MSRKTPIHAVSLQKLDEVLGRIEPLISEDDYRIIHGLASSCRQLFEAYHEKSQSVSRLLRMLFGPKTKKACSRQFIRGRTFQAGRSRNIIEAEEGAWTKRCRQVPWSRSGIGIP